MKKVKFRPKRVSISKQRYGSSTNVVELIFERNGKSGALKINDDRWHRLFSKVFENAIDLRDYDATADFKCYDIPSNSVFRVFGQLVIRKGFYDSHKFTPHKILDEDGKVWSL